MGRSKFFKDAKNVRHFRLVARSQNDRFAADPSAPALVLEPYAPPGVVKRSGLSQAELLTVPEDLEAALGPEVFAQPTDDLDTDPLDGTGAPDPNDLEGDCYFPRDGYNYEKHLKRASGGEGGGVVGVVIDAPPETQVPRKQLVLQPATNQEEVEILKALENAEEYEELEDCTLDEMVGGIAEATDIMLWGPTAEQDRDLPDLALFKNMRLQGSSLYEEEDEDDDCRSRGSRAGRSQAVSDADFEQFLEEEYGDDDIGACDKEEIEGKVSLDKCETLLDEYVFMKKEERARLASIYEPIKGTKDDVPRTIDETRAIIEKHYKFEDDSDETSSGGESEDESKTWDCETVLSTLSNISNRPGKIGRIKVVKKPMPALKSVKEGAIAEDAEEAGEDEEGVVELPDVNTSRPKGETPEERKARKAGVKEMRRLCRKMKKDSKDMYKTEAQKLPGHTGADVRGKTRCFRM